MDRNNEGGAENNRRLEIIKDHLLEEEVVGEVVIFKITVLQSVIEYEETAFDSEEDFQNAVFQELKKKHPFSPTYRRQLNEGFIQFSKGDNRLDCYYIRETPFRWDYVDVENQSIESMPLKRADPTYRVRINISFKENRVVMTFFGGIETLVFHTREMVCEVVRKYLYNFSTKHVRFSSKAMRNILDRFRKHVAVIDIDPRDNEKFSKIIEQKVKGKAEVKKVIVYDVATVRMAGISIIVSPEVRRLIEEEGIRLTQIRGGLLLPLGMEISTKVKSNGRVEFIIPSKYFGNDKDRIYEAAVKIYHKLIPSDLEADKGPLDRFM
jgi:hypothetical protein